MPQLLVILASVGSFLDNKLVSRLLQNLSKIWHTPVIMGSEIDDWVIAVLYGVKDIPPEKRAAVVKAELAQVQAKVDALTPEQKAEAQKLRPLHMNPMQEPLEADV